MLNKVKTRSGKILILPTPKEDVEITQAAMSDTDAKPLTNEEWESVKKNIIKLAN